MGRLPGRPAVAYGMVAFIAGVASLISWAFGLVIGALVARQVAIQARERGLRLHYPLLVASAYAGYAIWHMGYSSSAALFVATPGNALEKELDGGVIPVTETIFASWNIWTALISLLVITGLMAAMKPKEGRDEVVEISERAVADYHDSVARLERELGGARRRFFGRTRAAATPQSS
ncbi:MAG: hypothetical protein GEV09_28155, partial [Pseudonocardiaceae bacterium]|nr:hypothetical protein [Pseudonocardiaceae bacterium]